MAEYAILLYAPLDDNEHDDGGAARPNTNSIQKTCKTTVP